MERLLHHYRSCLQVRLRHWFGEEVDVVSLRPGEFSISHQEQTASLRFEADRCRWTLLLPKGAQEGSFDKMSKRMRQYFSGIPVF